MKIMAFGTSLGIDITMYIDKAIKNANGKIILILDSDIGNPPLNENEAIVPSTLLWIRGTSQDRTIQRTNGVRVTPNTKPIIFLLTCFFQSATQLILIISALVISRNKPQIKINANGLVLAVVNKLNPDT
jgi:hypothetical protein